MHDTQIPAPHRLHPPHRQRGLSSAALGALFLTLAAILLALPLALRGPAVAAREAAGAGGAAPRLLALARDNAAGSEIVGTVDATTGAITPLGAGIANCCTTAVLDAAPDPAGGRYFALLRLDGEGTDRVITFDTQTGAATASAPVTTTVAVNYLAYDPPSGQLLALVSTVSPQTLQAARINPASGELTLLGLPVGGCCALLAFDAAYDLATRRLFVVLQPDAAEPQPRLLIFNGADGALLGTVPVTDALEIDHLAFDASNSTLWALVYDPTTSAQRLAVIDPATGAVTPRGPGAADCCARLVTDVALDSAGGVLIAPLIDTSDPLVDDVPTLFRFSLATGEVVGKAPVDPNFTLHYIAQEGAAGTPPTITPTPTLHPSITASITPMPSVTPTPTRPPGTPAPTLPPTTPAADLYLPLLQRSSQ
jgi:hypothetical protein